MAAIAFLQPVALIDTLTSRRNRPSVDVRLSPIEEFEALATARTPQVLKTQESLL